MKNLKFVGRYSGRMQRISNRKQELFNIPFIVK